MKHVYRSRFITIKCILFSLIFLLMIVSAKAQSQRVSIIPEPASIREEKESFRFTNQTQIIADSNDTMLTKTIMLFTGELAVLTNIHLQSSDNKTTLNAIVISLSDNNTIPKEGYVLDIKPEQIHITASTPAGVFYAFESIKQLLPINTKNTK